MRKVIELGAKKRRRSVFYDIDSPVSVFHNAPCAVVAFDPVALAHVLDANFRARARCVHEAVVAEIDADVREGAAHRVEEDEVARLEFLLVDHVADFALLLGRARQKHAERVLENELNEPAAIESTVGIGAAAAVLDTGQFQTFEDQILRAGTIAFEQRRLVAQRRLDFGSVNGRHARESEYGSGKQVCDDFVTQHGAGI